MQCPVCKDVTLAIADRQGIEIDYCPKCRGVWLDRGELDKIIERTAQAEDTPTEAQWDRQRDLSPDDYREADRRKHHRKGKRRGLLGEIFDF